MGRKFILIMILAFSAAGATMFVLLKEGKYKFSQTLEDGELLKLSEITNSFRESEAPLIPEDVPLPGIKSVVVRSLDTEENSSLDLVRYVNSMASSEFGYWWMGEGATVYPLSYSTNGDGYGWIRETYYHALFQSKPARTLLFNQAVDIVAGLSRTNPPDFRKRVLAKLDALLTFSKGLPSLDLSAEPPEFEDYWTGFIYRRYRYDQVPALEIQNAITIAKGRISAVDVTKQPAGYYQLDINSQVSLLYTFEGVSLHSFSSTREVVYPTSVSLSSIKYLRDGTGDYYQVFGTRDGAEFKELYDKNLAPVRY